MSKIMLILSRNILIIILPAISILVSCKSDSKVQADEEISVENELPNDDSTSENTSSHDTFKAPSGEYDGFLLGKFTYDVAIDALQDEPNTELQGQVIEFTRNYRYKTTKGKSIIDQGRFNYKTENQRLTLNSQKSGSSEWEVKYIGGTMIWIGTSTYGNNSRQIRLYEYK